MYIKYNVMMMCQIIYKLGVTTMHFIGHCFTQSCVPSLQHLNISSWNWSLRFSVPTKNNLFIKSCVSVFFNCAFDAITPEKSQFGLYWATHRGPERAHAQHWLVLSGEGRCFHHIWMYLKQRGGEHDSERSHQLVLTLLLHLNSSTLRQKDKEVDQANHSEVSTLPLWPLTPHLFGLPYDLL